MRRTPGRREQPAHCLRILPGGKRAPEPVRGVRDIFVGDQLAAVERCPVILAARRLRIEQEEPSLLARADDVLLAADTGTPRD